MGIDILPTIARWIGAPLPALPIDGRDVSPALTGSSSPPRPFFFWYESNELQAVRYGRWKLHFPHRYRFTDDMPRAVGGRPAAYPTREIGLALFDLDADPGERDDVAALHPTVVAQLSGLALSMRQRLGDSLTSTRGTENRPAARTE